MPLRSATAGDDDEEGEAIITRTIPHRETAGGLRILDRVSSVFWGLGEVRPRGREVQQEPRETTSFLCLSGCRRINQ